MFVTYSKGTSARVCTSPLSCVYLFLWTNKGVLLEIKHPCRYSLVEQREEQEPTIGCPLKDSYLTKFHLISNNSKLLYPFTGIQAGLHHTGTNCNIDEYHPNRELRGIYGKVQQKRDWRISFEYVLVGISCVNVDSTSFVYILLVKKILFTKKSIIRV